MEMVGTEGARTDPATLEIRHGLGISARHAHPIKRRHVLLPQRNIRVSELFHYTAIIPLPSARGGVAQMVRAGVS